MPDSINQRGRRPHKSTHAALSIGSSCWPGQRNLRKLRVMPTISQCTGGIAGTPGAINTSILFGNLTDNERGSNEPVFAACPCIHFQGKGGAAIAPSSALSEVEGSMRYAPAWT